MTSFSRPSLFAKTFARIAPQMDRRGAGRHRAELVAGLSGSVVEIGCGPGGMFPHYPAAVTSVLAVEPDDYLRAIAEWAAARVNTGPADTAGRTDAERRAGPMRSHTSRITVVAGMAENLPVDDGSVDAAVFSLVLCSVTDRAAALAEARRVLRPGGELRFYEHVRSTSRVLGALQDVVTPLWRRAAGNCHPNRDTVAAIERAGFLVQRVRRFGFAPAAGLPPVAHVIGIARPVGDNL